MNAKILNKTDQGSTHLPAMGHLFVCIMLTVGWCIPAWGIKVTNDDLNFTLAVPDRYIQLPSSGDTLYTFGTSDPRGGVPDALIIIQRLHGRLGHGHVDLEKTGIQDAILEKGKWNSLDIDVVAGHKSKYGTTFSVRGAQIPLEGEAIQVIALVPLEREASADGVLQDFLDGLDGPSGWSNGSNLSAYERGRLVGQGAGQMVVIVALLAGAVFMIVRYLQPDKNGNDSGENNAGQL